MAKYRALYTDYPWADVEIERRLLAEVDCELIVAPDNKEETQARLASGMDVILTCWAPVTARVIDAADRCRHIARTGIGLDNINVEHATKRKILVTNVPDYCVNEVAEHTIGLIFALGRGIAGYHLATKNGQYDLVAGLPAERISGKTLGIIGLGQIGKILARRAHGVGMRVIGTNRSGTTHDGVDWVRLHDLLAQSDYVSVQAPLTPETKHLINRETLRMMKPTAYLINTARGGLVDHAALAEALQAGVIAGAALDVQTPEPPDLSQAPYNDPRVIVTPHVAFYSSQATDELRTRVGQQVAAFLRGERPENIVNPAAIDS
ncbi:C-terminal binding protein [Lacipirellula parvula]|uniref:D-3-phosphoglycerate dehydrogenase n=1 Tax=Lacipirellula parvula TaxID=2650471 RepID=A0A5K7X6E0_9BACT|nr:C-terminal binding protein [Lacipirellula parvula]BBO31407.1 D-3-phosphoglycerate dehydrogenase [Lacipirellula parvula]